MNVLIQTNVHDFKISVETGCPALSSKTTIGERNCDSRPGGWRVELRYKRFTRGVKRGGASPPEAKACVSCWAPQALHLDSKTVRKERSRSNQLSLMMRWAGGAGEFFKHKTIRARRGGWGFDSGAGGVQTAKASRKQSSLSGKESAQGCIPKRLLGRPD